MLTQSHTSIWSLFHTLNTTADHTTPGGTPSSLVERVALQSHALEQCRKETKVVLTQFLDNAMRCAQILTEMHTYLATFIQRSLLEKQQTLDQVCKQMAIYSQLGSEFAEVCKQMAIYRQLGPEFEEVVQEYGRVKAELVQAQARLDIFNQMENELMPR
eukprot:gene2798-12672_t